MCMSWGNQTTKEVFQARSEQVQALSNETNVLEERLKQQQQQIGSDLSEEEIVKRLGEVTANYAGACTVEMREQRDR